MGAGKGDKIRTGANLRAYWDNYDRIFRKNEDQFEEWWQELCKSKGTSPHNIEEKAAAYNVFNTIRDEK